MAIVITDGTRYIQYTENQTWRLTENAEDAYQFDDANTAVNYMQDNKQFTIFYYAWDTETQKIVWQWMEPEEAKRIAEAGQIWQGALAQYGLKKKKHKIKRKTYSDDVRRLLYKNADGKCALCGRKITLEEMTIDHIMPLVMNGPDRVDNLQACCKGCNLLKGAALPEDFANRVNSIFMYQMERKYANKITWRLANWMLRKLG